MTKGCPSGQFFVVGVGEAQDDAQDFLCEILIENAQRAR
jgi:hypothetical protein